MTQRLIAVAVLMVLLLAGSGFYSFSQSAKAGVQQLRKAQCAVAYELVLRQLLERADTPGGQVSAPLLTQLQILEDQPCVEDSLRAELLPQGGAERLLPLAKAASTPQGMATFIAALYPLLKAVGDQATAAASSQSRMVRMQARYREAMPLFGGLEQAVTSSNSDALQKHIDAMRRDFGAGADTDAFEMARVAYNEALQQTEQALRRDAAAVPAAAQLARSRLTRLYDAAIVGQNAALQAQIEARQLDQRLATIALAVLIVIVLIAGVLMATAIARDRRRRLQDLVQVSRRTAQGELGLVVDARSGGSKVSELENAFNAMTADLSRRYQKIIDELKVALDAAKSAERAKSDFLHNVSHEIRTPINAILGMAHMTLQTPLDRRQKDYVGTIHRESKALIALVNDILDFSKIEAGKMEAEQIEFDLQDVLDPLMAATRDKALAKGLGFESALAADVPLALVGDPKHLGQILGHYASNAVKFTERGHIEFVLSTVQQSADQVLLRFAFTDTGIGMSAEQMGGLFKSIRQGDGSATRKYGGTGLGLVLSQQLATLMGGEVGAESTLGSGSTFWLQLSFGHAQHLVARQAAPPVLVDVDVPAPSESVPNALPAFDATLLETLQSQIESYDSQATDTVGALREVLGEAAPQPLLQMDVHLSNFAFDEASALLPALRAALGRLSP